MTINKTCIIVHGCTSSPVDTTYNKHWLPWLKRELISQGIETQTPLMPKPRAPVYEDYKKEFEKLSVDEDTILIGHSCGCAFLVRRLGETKKKIAKLILVAPWKFPDEGDEIQAKFYDYVIDESIITRAQELIIFTADDEDDEGKESVKIFHKALGGNFIELQGRGHYVIGDMKTEEFPELLQLVLK